MMSDVDKMSVHVRTRHTLRVNVSSLCETH